MISVIPTRLAALTVLAFIVMFSGCSGNEAEKHAWLHGTWELTFNPDNDDSDVLTFKPDGTVTVDTIDGRQISGQYAVLDQELALTLVSNQKIVDVRFTISPDQSRLIYENGAYYTRRS